MKILLSPPLAFLIYIALVLLLVLLGRFLAGPGHPEPLKRTLYGSGEEAARWWAAPGYRPFFLVALFFAVLHLGALVLGTAGTLVSALPFLLGLIVILVAFLLG
jgi:NADH:ubiquinone oxidoreductase subunit 3 (subunit A)